MTASNPLHLQELSRACMAQLGLSGFVVVSRENHTAPLRAHLCNGLSGVTLQALLVQLEQIFLDDGPAQVTHKTESLDGVAWLAAHRIKSQSQHHWFVALSEKTQRWNIKQWHVLTGCAEALLTDPALGEATVKPTLEASENPTIALRNDTHIQDSPMGLAASLDGHLVAPDLEFFDAAPDVVPNDVVPDDVVPNDGVTNDVVPNDAVPNDPTEQFRQFVESAHIGIAVFDQTNQGNDVPLEVNTALAEMLGYGLDEIRALDFSTLAVEEDLEQERLVYQQEILTNQRSHYRFEKRYRRKDGSIIWVNLTATYSRNTTGHVTRAAVLFEDITATKKANLERLHMQMRLQMHLQGAPFAVIEWDANSTITVWNPVAEATFGYTAEEALGQNIQVLLKPPQHQSEQVRLFDELVAQGKSKHSVIEILTKHAGLRRLDWASNCLFDHNGQLVSVLGVVRDVTTEHQNQIALFESREQYKQIVNTINGVVWEGEMGVGVTFISERVEEVFGYTPEEWMDSPDFWENHIHPQDRDRVIAEFMQHVQESQNYSQEYRFLTKDNRVVWVRGENSIVREPGKATKLRGINFDITDEKIADAAIEASEERYKSLVNTVDGIYWEAQLEPFEGMTFVSHQAERLLGYSPEEWMGNQYFWEDHIHPEDREVVLNQTKIGIKTRQSYRTEYRMIAKNGTIVWFRDFVTVIANEDDTGRRLRGLMVDTTFENRAKQLEFERNRILELVVNDSPLELSLRQVTQMLESQPEVACCALFVLEHGRPRYKAGSLSPELQELFDGRGLPQVDTTRTLEMRHRITASGQLIMALDVTRDPIPPHFRDAMLEEGLNVAWESPIFSGQGETIGLVVSFHNNFRHFDTMDLTLLETAGRLAAVAIENRLAKEKLDHQANHDTLTNLPNRKLFENRLEQSLSNARRKARQLAVMFVDLDEFKRINDTLGHAVGDQLLIGVAARLRAIVRAEDTVARFGGDEFLMLIEDLPDANAALRIANNILETFSTPFLVDGREFFISVSIGITVFPGDGEDAISMIRASDSAMYRAKSEGRNRFSFYTAEMHRAATERLELENELRVAIEHDELELHYQAQYDMHGQLSGAEALVRWNHPTRGFMPPNQFIPLAEVSGLIFSLERWVLHAACRAAVQWGNMNAAWVSVNVSAKHFLMPDFIERIQNVLQETQLAPERLELELTESVFVNDLEEASGRIMALKRMGVRVALDDFGTGYSSLGYLQRLPVDVLKIDKSFLAGLHEEKSVDFSRSLELEPQRLSTERSNETNAALVLQSIVNLAHALGLEVVVEGVETLWQHKMIRLMNVDRAQGYLLTRPVTLDVFEQQLAQQSIHWGNVTLSDPTPRAN